MSVNVKFQNGVKTFATTFSQTGKSFGANMGNTQNVTEIMRGATFIPSVSAEGVISWTNDADLTNPAPVNIKGEKGDPGEKGETGAQGIQGIQGAKGDKGDTGATGAAGRDGIDGKDGANGADGVGIQSMEQWYYLSKYPDDYKGGSWSRVYPTWQEGKYLWTRQKINYTDGRSETMSPICVTGSKGATGAPGATPAKGTDYWTASDKAQMVSDVIAALPVYDGSVVSV